MAKGKEEQSSQFPSGKTTTALVLIIVGVIFLLSNLGLLPSDIFGKLWPLFIIIPGVLMLFQAKK